MHSTLSATVLIVVVFFVSASAADLRTSSDEDNDDISLVQKKFSITDLKPAPALEEAPKAAQKKSPVLPKWAKKPKQPLAGRHTDFDDDTSLLQTQMQLHPSEEELDDDDEGSFVQKHFSIHDLSMPAPQVDAKAPPQPQSLPDVPNWVKKAIGSRPTDMSGVYGDEQSLFQKKFATHFPKPEPEVLKKQPQSFPDVPHWVQKNDDDTSLLQLHVHAIENDDDDMSLVQKKLSINDLPKPAPKVIAKKAQKQPQSFPDEPHWVQKFDDDTSLIQTLVQVSKKVERVKLSKKDVQAHREKKLAEKIAMLQAQIRDAGMVPDCLISGGTAKGCNLVNESSALFEKLQAQATEVAHKKRKSSKIKVEEGGSDVVSLVRMVAVEQWKTAEPAATSLMQMEATLSKTVRKTGVVVDPTCSADGCDDDDEFDDDIQFMQSETTLSKSDRYLDDEDEDEDDVGDIFALSQSEVRLGKATSVHKAEKAPSSLMQTEITLGKGVRRVGLEGEGESECDKEDESCDLEDAALFMQEVTLLGKSNRYMGEEDEEDESDDFSLSQNEMQLSRVDEDEAETRSSSSLFQSQVDMKKGIRKTGVAASETGCSEHEDCEDGDEFDDHMQLMQSETTLGKSNRYGDEDEEEEDGDGEAADTFSLVRLGLKVAAAEKAVSSLMQSQEDWTSLIQTTMMVNAGDTPDEMRGDGGMFDLPMGIVVNRRSQLPADSCASMPGGCTGEEVSLFQSGTVVKPRGPRMPAVDATFDGITLFQDSATLMRGVEPAPEVAIPGVDIGFDGVSI